MAQHKTNVAPLRRKVEDPITLKTTVSSIWGYIARCKCGETSGRMGTFLEATYWSHEHLKEHENPDPKQAA